MATLDLRSNAEPEDAPPAIKGCPRCLSIGMVRTVSEAVRGGARLPAVAPDVRLAGRRKWALVSGVLALIPGWALADTVFGGGHAPVVPAFTVFFGFAATSVLNSLGTIGILKRRKRIRAGRDAALAVWSEGWFCGRCGALYFQPGYEPKGVGLHQPLSPAQFQREVFRVGGYEDLASET